MNNNYRPPKWVNPDNAVGFYRGYYGYSQQRLADESHVPLRSIQKIESGNLGVQLYKVAPLAAYIGISLDALVRNDLAAIIPLLVAPPVDPQAKENFRRVQELTLKLGTQGEVFITDREREKLAGTPFVKAVNRNPADDPMMGYDIFSFTCEGQPLFIEVKTTNQACNKEFHMSAVELDYMEDCLTNGRNYELHRVYNLRDGVSPDVEIYSPQRLKEECEFVACDYIVRKKGGE